MQRTQKSLIKYFKLIFLILNSEHLMIWLNILINSLFFPCLKRIFNIHFFFVIQTQPRRYFYVNACSGFLRFFQIQYLNLKTTWGYPFFIEQFNCSWNNKHIEAFTIFLKLFILFFFDFTIFLIFFSLFLINYLRNTNNNYFIYPLFRVTKQLTKICNFTFKLLPYTT